MHHIFDLSFEAYQESGAVLFDVYAARVRMLPIEYIIANLAGFPVATLRIAPNDNISRTKPE